MKNKILSFFLCIVLATGFTACGRENKWIFSLNGENLYDKEVTAFGLIYAKEYNIVSKDQLEEQDENGKIYSESCKEALEEEIISTVLLYKEAKNAKYELTKEDEKTIEENTENLIQFYGEEWVKEQKISASDIENVYKMMFLGNSYVESLSEKEDTEGETGNEKERYIKVYQVTFPIVQLDENGMVQSGPDGKLKKLSASEISQKEEEANDFKEKVQAGEKMETLIEEYDDTVTGMEKYMKYADLDTAYKKAVAFLSEGDISDVIEASNGFYVVKLLESDATDYAEMIGSYKAGAEGQEKKSELSDSLYNTYVQNNKNYKNEKQWEKITFFSFIK